MKKILMGLVLMGLGVGYSQNNVVIADMQQDMALIKSQFGQIKLELEEMRRENKVLMDRVRKAESASMSVDFSSVKAEMGIKNEAMKKEVLSHVKKELEAMATQLNRALEKMAGAVNRMPKETLPTNFSENYPKNGIEYTVRSGDTLSRIASQNKSRIKWIQDANKIADPNRGLRVGESIFIPQE